MKNQIIIDIDTEKEKPIIIAKGKGYEPPKTKEEAQVMIITDIACVVDALLSMIHVADQNSYVDKNVIVGKIIKELNQYLTLPSTKETE
jgi:hypothetical protein